MTKMEFNECQINWLNQFKDPDTPVVGLYGDRGSGRTVFGLGMLLSVMLSKPTSKCAIIVHNQVMVDYIRNMLSNFLYDVGLNNEILRNNKSCITLINKSTLFFMTQDFWRSRLAGLKLDAAFMDCDLPFVQDAELRHRLMVAMNKDGKLIISRDL